MISSPNSYFTAEEAKTANEPVVVFTLGSGASEYEVPQEDIIDPGSLSLSRPYDFSDLVSGDHTLTLNNDEGIYSPGKSTFIWAGTTWYRQAIKIELGYRRPGYQGVIDKITLYEGLITEWRVSEVKDADAGAAADGVTVEISSRDHVSLMAERQIGMPDSSGNPQPVVYGTVFKDLMELGDQRPGWSPNKTANFDAGNLTEVTVATSGAGTVTASNVQSYTGSYSARCETLTTVDNAYFTLAANTAYNSMLGTCELYIDTLPGLITSLQATTFFYLANSGGIPIASLEVGPGGDVYLYDPYTTTRGKINFNLYEYQGRWVRLSVAYRRAPAGLYGAIRIYLNGGEIGSRVASFANNVQFMGCGSYLCMEDGNYVFYFDDLKMDYQSYPFGYYLQGAPYQEVISVWSEGALLPKQKRVWEGNLPYINSMRDSYKARALARFFPYDQWDDYPAYGMIDCIQLGDLPSGGIFAEMKHDTDDHPVDIIEGLLTAAGLDSYIDATNFADCKTANPDDVIGCYFTETTVGQAISTITSLVLYDLVERQGALCLIPYAGTPLVASVLTLSRSNCFSFEQNFDMSNVKTGITAKWGWYEQDKTKYYRTEDATLKAILGDQTMELDFSYGSDVSSDDGDTAQAKADLLKKRLCGAVESIKASGFLPLARLELGDGVLIQCLFNDSDLIYEVAEKVINFAEWTVEITANRYLGE